jgi:deubiquitinase DESI2
MSKTIVRLNVYDLMAGQAQGVLHALGVGLYHTAVELNDAEWSFGACESGTGVFSSTPRVPLMNSVYRETVDIGVTTLSQKEIQNVIAELSAAYLGSSYDITTKNCNTFTNALCLKLTGNGIPGWINRAASIGSTLNSVLPLSSLGLMPPSRTDSASSATSGASASTTTTTAFSGTGHKLTDDSSSAPSGAPAPAAGASAGAAVVPSAEELRQRRLAAFEKRQAASP